MSPISTKINAAFTFSEMVAFVGLAKRHFFGHDGYSNRDNYRLVIQRFDEPGKGSLQRTRRRDGTRSVYVMAAVHRVPCPSHVDLERVELDVDLLRALVTCSGDADADKFIVSKLHVSSTFVRPFSSVLRYRGGTVSSDVGTEGLLVAGLAAAPATVASEPCHDTPVESSQASIKKGRLGVFVLGITPELRKHYGDADDRGVLVARVEAGSPAAAAGLQAGDVITDAGGRAIDQASDLISAVAGVAKDKSLDLKVVRDHKTMLLSAKLTSDPVGFMVPDWFHEMFRRFEPMIPRTSSST